MYGSLSHTRKTLGRLRKWALPVIGVTTLYSAAGQLPYAYALVPPLENRFQAPQTLANTSVKGIIALGGDFNRMVEAVRIAKQLPHARLIISGRGENRWVDYARKEGIDSDRLIDELQSRNTFENAQFSSKLLRPAPSERWVLVTSAAHMPRAVGSFRRAGFSVIPWPVRSKRPGRAPSNSVAKHEWLGLVAYRLLGRTDALFPGPDDATPSIALNPSRHTEETKVSSWLSKKAL